MADKYQFECVNVIPLAELWGFANEHGIIFRRPADGFRSRRGVFFRWSGFEPFMPCLEPAPSTPPKENLLMQKPLSPYPWRTAIKSFGGKRQRVLSWIIPALIGWQGVRGEPLLSDSPTVLFMATPTGLAPAKLRLLQDTVSAWSINAFDPPPNDELCSERLHLLSID